MDFAETVRTRGAGVVSAFLENGGRSDVDRSVKNLIEETTHEYGGRFLLELLQNAHDSHSPDAGGRVLLRFDHAEGRHGTLYVADCGLGFRTENFREICNLAQSSKTVGEGIGHKGVGFKSVLQVCEEPEIYSCDPDCPERDGFCFGFATEEDLRLLSGDEFSFRAVLENVSRYTVPVPIPTVPGPVRELRDRGYSTVLRLPLRSPGAANEVGKRFDELTSEQAPVALFLSRLSELRLVRCTRDHEATEMMVRRTTEKVDLAAAGSMSMTAEIVTVDGEHKFFVASRRLDHALLLEAIREAVESSQLSRRHQEWDAPAFVSLAVPLDGGPITGRLYTHLPMGQQAVAPIPGHLNAPFRTDFARQAIIWDHPLNLFLLDEAAALAVDVNRLLLTEPDHIWSTVAIDLVTWSTDFADHLVGADRQRPVKLPVTSESARDLRDVRLWPSAGLRFLTPELVVGATDLVCLRPGLGEEREHRLQQLARRLGHSLPLNKEELAAAIESIAGWCAARAAPLADWDALYADIATMFPTELDARHLSGRLILLREDSTLGPCLAAVDHTRDRDGQRRRRDDPVPFFPPVRQVTDGEDEVDPDIDLELPASMHDRLFFVHKDLAWFDEKRNHTPARSFLQGKNLVRRFDGRSLVDLVRSVLTTTTAPTVHADALRFLFELHRGRRVSVDAVGVRLPTIGGELLDADQVLFSSCWPGTSGALVESITGVSKDACPELHELGKNLLVAPEQLLRPEDDVTAWSAFLLKIGVVDGIPVQRASDRRAIEGSQLRADNLTSAGAVPPGVREHWREHLRENTAGQFPRTEYRASSKIAWLPGQDTYDALPVPARCAYSQLVLAGLDSWSENDFTTTWSRRNPSNPDPRRVSTPLSVFVRTANWLIVKDRLSGAQTFAPPSRAWLDSSDNDAPPPPFVPMVLRSLRREIERSPRVRSRLVTAGLSTWNTAGSAQRQLNTLAEIAHRGVGVHHISQLMKCYRAVWNLLLDKSGGSNAVWPDRVIVRVGDEMRTVPAAEFTPDHQLVITEDGDERFLRQVIEDFDLPVLHLDRGADALRDALAADAPDAVARPAQLGIAVTVDDEEFVPDPNARQLVGDLPWLVDVVIGLLEHRMPPHERPSDPQLRMAAAQLDSIRVVTATDIAVEIPGQQRLRPQVEQPVLPVPDREAPTLVVRGEEFSEQWTWHQVDSAAEPLLRLVGQNCAAPQLRLAISRLRQFGNPGDHMDMAALSEACEITEEELAHTHAQLNSGPREVADRLRPVIRCLWGPRAQTAFDTAVHEHEAALTGHALEESSAARVSSGWRAGWRPAPSRAAAHHS